MEKNKRIKVKSRWKNLDQLIEIGLKKTGRKLIAEEKKVPAREL